MGGAAVSRSRPWVAWVTLVALLVPVGVSFAVWRTQAARAEEVRAGRALDREALEAARRETLVLTSIDYRRADEYAAAVERGSTGAFLAEFKKTEKDAVAFIKRNRSVQVPTIPEGGIALLERRGDEAQLIVAMDVQVTNSSAEKPQRSDYRLRVTMSKVDGRWRISDMEPVNAQA